MYTINLEDKHNLVSVCVCVSLICPVVSITAGSSSQTKIIH